MSYHYSFLDKSIVLQLQHMLRLYNPYINVFIIAKERLSISKNISLCLKTINTGNLNHCRYNRLTVSEIVAIILRTL